MPLLQQGKSDGLTEVPRWGRGLQLTCLGMWEQVRAFLDYHGVPYRAVEVNPLMKKEIKWSGHRKVPIVVVDGEKLVESSEIIDELRNRLAKSNAGWLTSSSEYRKESQKESQWRRWVDDRWVHVITPNIYRTVGEAKQAFDYMTTAGNFGFVEREVARWFGAAFMYGLSKYRLKPRHGIHEERPALYEAAQQWCEGLGGKPFMGGRRPGLADLSMFGATRAIKGMDAFNDLMANTPIRPWYERMEARVGPTSQLPQE